MTLHALPVCRPAEHIPPDVSQTAPQSADPPTVVLKAGDAVAFSSPPGSVVHAVGSSEQPIATVVCQSSRGVGAARVTLVLGRGPGFAQIGIVGPGSAPLRRALVTVTG